LEGDCSPFQQPAGSINHRRYTADAVPSPETTLPKLGGARHRGVETSARVLGKVQVGHYQLKGKSLLSFYGIDHVSNKSILDA
jgi:hypothetical protein